MEKQRKRPAEDVGSFFFFCFFFSSGVSGKKAKSKKQTKTQTSPELAPFAEKKICYLPGAFCQGILELENLLPSNGFSIEPLKVKLLAGEQKATKSGKTEKPSN